MPTCPVNDGQSSCTIAHREHLWLLNPMSRQPLFLTSGLLCGLGDLTAGLLGLGHGLDDTNSDGLEKVSKSKSIKAIQ